MYDKSDLKEHPLYSNTNKKLLGKMKDKWARTTVAEYVSEIDNVIHLKADKKKVTKNEGCK